MVALRRGKTKGVKATPWLSAQAVFAYVVAFALRNLTTVAVLQLEDVCSQSTAVRTSVATI